MRSGETACAHARCGAYAEWRVALGKGVFRERSNVERRTLDSVELSGAGESSRRVSRRPSNKAAALCETSVSLSVSCSSLFTRSVDICGDDAIAAALKRRRITSRLFATPRLASDVAFVSTSSRMDSASNKRTSCCVVAGFPQKTASSATRNGTY